MSMQPTVLVLGGTGRIGTAFLEQARAKNSHLKFRLLTRNPYKLKCYADADGIVVQQGDLLSPESLAQAMDGIQQVFFIVPDAPDMVEMERNVYEAARKHGSVQHVLKISAILAGARPHPAGFGILHRQGEELLRQEAALSGFAYTILRPCMFAQSLELFQDPIMGLGVILSPSGQGRISFVDVRDVAACALELLLHEHEQKNRVYTLTGPTAYTMEQAAKLLTQHMGRSVRHFSPPEWLSYWIYRILAGMDAFMARNVRDLFVAVKAGQEEEVSDAILLICKRAPTSLQAYLLDQKVFPSDKKSL